MAGDEAAGAVARSAMHDLAKQMSIGGELTVGDALAATVALRDAADGLVFELVGFARDAGASWAEIGAALGVTTQAAHQRFGRRAAD